MKRFIGRAFVFCLIILSSKFSFSQVIFGVFGGPQMTTAKYKVREEKQATEFKPGFQLGATMKVPFDNRLYFAPTAYYSMKGYKVTLQDSAFPPTQVAKNNDTRIHTIEVAPLLQYDFSNQPSHFFIKLGPALDFAFSGTEKFDTIGGTAPIKRSMNFSFTEYGRVTAQAILHLGFESGKGYFVFAHYAEGLGGLNNADNGPTIKHRIVGLSFGWFFHRNRNVIDTRLKE
jgi:hypothetical protein